MACFTEYAEMIDVSRTFTGQEDIRAWAAREVIPGGDTFRHREILEQADGYAKTEVNWLAGSSTIPIGGMPRARSPRCHYNTLTRE